MDTYRATIVGARSQDSVTRELKRFVRRMAPRKSQRAAAIAVAATIPLTDAPAAKTAELMQARGR